MHKQCKTATLGRNAVDLVGTFPAKFPNISCFYFKSYAPEPSVEQRLDLKQVATLAGLSTRQLLAHDSNVAELVEQMLTDIDVDESTGWTEVRAGDLASKLPQLQTECDGRGEVLALYSHCRDLRGCELHIPMMDFRIKSGDDYGQLNLMKKALNKIGQSDGVLLDSGNSYHYYGFQLLNESHWRWFMAACLLLEPLVDVRYISHRMLAGKAALRLTTARLKPKAPEIVACLR